MQKVTSILSETGQDVSGRFLESGMQQPNQVTGFLHTASAPPPKPNFIAKTVDYGHGHGKCSIFCTVIILNIVLGNLMIFFVNRCGCQGGKDLVWGEDSTET